MASCSLGTLTYHIDWGGGKIKILCLLNNMELFASSVEDWISYVKRLAQYVNNQQQ